MGPIEDHGDPERTPLLLLPGLGIYTRLTGIGLERLGWMLDP